MFKRWYLETWAIIVQLEWHSQEIHRLEKILFWRVLINAQGEDVVAGTRTPQHITKKSRKNSDSRSFDGGSNA